MVKEGMLIGGRYELRSLVGSGGMADVYHAIDTRLNRTVAIKILKEEYSQDKNFVIKFRGEAQSAAGLSHPNVVNVYDVGEENDLHYIVMELVEGITLKKFIERKGKLEVKDAVGIAIQIAQGMEAAHINHIIHRDIKPQNIIISKEGKVKVTDFGIAKAATSNTIAAGQAIGSVHYISPEQARGGYSDEKSDIYSLGVTLYEMLSGKMPFAAENTVSVALLHIQGEAVPLRQLDPLIPVSVERIVQKCMQKKPERRYLTATELIHDLKLSISDPDGDFVQVGGAVVTDSPTINISGEELQRIKSARIRENGSKVDGYQRVRRQAPVPPPVKPIEQPIGEHEDDMDPKIEKMILFGGIAAIIILAAVIIFLVVKGFNLFGGKPEDPKTALNHSSSSQKSSDKIGSETQSNAGSKIVSEPEALVVPELKGRTLTEAIELLGEAKITSYRFVYESSEEFKKDEVISVEPKEGTEIRETDEVVITVCNGEKKVKVPVVKDMTKDAAVAELQKLKLTVTTVTEFNDRVPAGKVIGTNPASGTELKEGNAITVIVSNGPEVKKVSVPNVLGKTEEEAVKMIQDAKLKTSVTYKNDDNVADGNVIKQGIQAGAEVEEGSTVSLVVSTGPEKPPVVYTYTAGITIDENPFKEAGQSGLIEVKMDQDNKTTVIYSGTLEYGDFPLVIDNIEGSSEEEGICYMYVDGELFVNKIWRITEWNKAEVDGR